MDEANVYYFGCWRESGHYLWKPGRSHAWDDERNGVLPWKFIDGCLPPARRGRPDSRGYRSVEREAPQGHAALHYKEGWTAFAFWDRSVDTRGGCNSAFFVRGIHSWEDALRIAKAKFPSVWKQIKFDVILAQEPDGGKHEGIMSVEDKAADYDALRARVREMEARLREAGLDL